MAWVGLARWRFSGSRRVYAYRWLAKGLRQGRAPVVLLQQMADHASDDGQRANDPSAVAYREWSGFVGGGGELGVAMRHWAPPEHVTLVQAGEKSENVAASLDTCAYLEEASGRMRMALIGAIAYPMGLGSMLVVLVHMCATRVLPYFEVLVPRKDWAGFASYLPGVFDFMLGWGLVSFLLFFVVLAVAVRWVLPRWVSPVRDALEWLMVFREYRAFQGALFLVGFSELISTRLPLPEALMVLRENAQPWMRSKIDGILREVGGGLDPADAIWRADRHFPDVALNRELRIVMSMEGYQEEMGRMAVQWVDGTVDKFKVFGARLRMMFIAANAMLLGALIAALGQLSRQVSSTVQGF